MIEVISTKGLFAFLVFMFMTILCVNHISSEKTRCMMRGGTYTAGFVNDDFVMHCSIRY